MPSSKKQTQQSIDWTKLKQRLEKSKTALEESHQLSAERAQTILEERARAMARVPSQAPDAGALLEVVTFALGSERYAIETAHVREVLRLRDCMPLPGTPDFLVGVTNLRGQIVAIMDLRVFFGIPSQGTSDQSRIIVLGHDRIEFGMLADAVFEVAMLRIDEVRESPGSVTGIAREYVRGVTADSLILLDGSILLKDPRLFIDLGDNTGTAAPEVNP